MRFDGARRTINCMSSCCRRFWTEPIAPLAPPAPATFPPAADEADAEEFITLGRCGVRVDEYDARDWGGTVSRKKVREDYKSPSWQLELDKNPVLPWPPPMSFPFTQLELCRASALAGGASFRAVHVARARARARALALTPNPCTPSVPRRDQGRDFGVRALPRVE